MNKRLDRLNIAKRVLQVNENAGAAEIAQIIRGIERRRAAEKLRPVGEYLRGFKCAKK